MRLEEIEKKLEKVELTRKELKAEQAKALGRRQITCTTNHGDGGCGARFQIGSLTYIQAHYYVSPYGCAGGDYWNQKEGGFDCPKCGYRNRLYTYDRNEFQELKRYFKEIVDELKG